MSGWVRVVGGLAEVTIPGFRLMIDVEDTGRDTIGRETKVLPLSVFEERQNGPGHNPSSNPKLRLISISGGFTLGVDEGFGLPEENNVVRAGLLTDTDWLGI